MQRGRHRRYGSSLGRRFDLLWLGQAVSQLGDQLAYLTVPLFVLHLNRGRNFDFAFAYALETGPALLVGAVGGVLLDRIRMRWAMIVADVLRAGAFLVLAWTALHPPDAGTAVGVVFVVAFAVGLCSAFFGSALLALLPALVESRGLASANGRIATTQQTAIAVGPLLAGYLYATVGATPAFLFNAATFVVSAITLLAVGRVPRAQAARRTGILNEAVNGLLYLWNELRLRASTIAAAVANFVMGFLEATFVVLAANLNATTDWEKGVLLAVFGMGGIAGAAVASIVARFIGLGKTMVLGLALAGIDFLGAFRTTYGAATLSFFFAAAFGLALVNVPLATIRQIYTPAVMLGRVMAASRAVGYVTLPLGALLGAALADQRVAALDYMTVARAAPIILIITAGTLVFTPIWSATFGPAARRRSRRSVRIVDG